MSKKSFYQTDLAYVQEPNGVITSINVNNSGASYIPPVVISPDIAAAMKPKIFAGIGAHNDGPDDVCKEITKLARMMAEKGWILRSGGATCVDSAFEAGYEGYDDLKQIFLPWKHYNNNESQYYTVCEQAKRIAELHHPAWDKVKTNQAVVKLHGRNTYQILGIDLKTPCTKVICWTPNGVEVGGTAQAIRVAKSYNIPVINLFKITKK